MNIKKLEMKCSIELPFNVIQCFDGDVGEIWKTFLSPEFNRFTQQEPYINHIGKIIELQYNSEKVMNECVERKEITRIIEVYPLIPNFLTKFMSLIGKKVSYKMTQRFCLDELMADIMIDRVKISMVGEVLAKGKMNICTPQNNEIFVNGTQKHFFNVDLEVEFNLNWVTEPIYNRIGKERLEEEITLKSIQVYEYTLSLLEIYHSKKNENNFYQ